MGGIEELGVKMVDVGVDVVSSLVMKIKNW